MNTPAIMRLVALLALVAVGAAGAFAQASTPASDSDPSAQATLSMLLSNAQQRAQDLDQQIAALDAGHVPAGQDAAAARANLLDMQARNAKVIADCQRRLGGGSPGPAAPSFSNAPSIPYSGPRSPFDSTFGVNYASQSGPSDQGGGGSSSGGGMSSILSMLGGGSSDWRVLAISTALGLGGYFAGHALGGFWGGMVGSLIGGIGGQWLAQKIVTWWDNRKNGAAGPGQPPAPDPTTAGPPQGGPYPGTQDGSGWQGVPPQGPPPASGPLPTDPSAAFQEMQARYTQFQQVTDSGASAASVALAYQNYLAAKHNYDTLLTGAGR